MDQKTPSHNAPKTVKNNDRKIFKFGNDKIKSEKSSFRNDQHLRKSLSSLRQSTNKSFKKPTPAVGEVSSTKYAHSKRSNSAKIEDKRSCSKKSKSKDLIHGMIYGMVDGLSDVSNERKNIIKVDNSLDNHDKLKAKREFFKHKMATCSRSSSRNKHSLKSSSKPKSRDKNDESLQTAMWDLDEINEYLKDYEVNRKKSKLLFEDAQLILTELGFIHSGGRQAMKKDPTINIHKERDLLPIFFLIPLF